MKPEELLEISEKSSAVAFHKFVLLCKGRESDLFCFFEGRDSQYYSSRIKTISKRKYQPISCGNKKSVIEVYDWLSSHSDYSKYPKAFFVDRDFDPLIGNNGIYETPCYSVENFYVNAECLSEILKNEFSLTEIDVEYNTILELFNTELNKHNECTIFFNAWYATLKQKKIKEKLSTTGVNLDDKLPKDFVCIKIGSISSNYDLDKIKSSFPNAINVTEEEVMSMQQELKKNCTSDNLRGKFQLMFYCEFLKYLIEDANKNKKILSKRTKFNVDRANIYTQLSQYAVTPNCLTKYLERFAV